MSRKYKYVYFKCVAFKFNVNIFKPQLGITYHEQVDNLMITEKYV